MGVMISAILWKIPFKLSRFHYAKSILVHEIDYASESANLAWCWATVSVAWATMHEMTDWFSCWFRTTILQSTMNATFPAIPPWFQHHSIPYLVWSLYSNSPSIFQKIPITINSNKESQILAPESSHIVHTCTYSLLWPTLSIQSVSWLATFHKMYQSTPPWKLF